MTKLFLHHQTVVQRLVDDTSWTQELANSINRRKEDQSHLAEEKVPEILDLTKNDPNFTDFHALLPGKSVNVLYLSSHCSVNDSILLYCDYVVDRFDLILELILITINIGEGVCPTICCPTMSNA